MRVLYVLPLVGLAALCQAGPNWTPYTAARDEFRVTLPDRSVMQEAHGMKAGTFEITSRSYVAQSENVKCIVTAFQTPKGMGLDEISRFTQAISEGFRSNLGTENIKRSVRANLSLRGEYVSLTSKGRQLGIWIFLYQGRVYALSYAAPKNRSTETEDTFFSSFRVNVPPSVPLNENRAALSGKR